MSERPSLTIGIEEEYQIIDPETRELRSFITQFLDGERMIMVEREIKPELHQAMVELGTPVCHTLEQARDELVKQRRFIIDLAAQKGLAVAAAATHPFSRWFDQSVTPLPRYAAALNLTKMIADTNTPVKTPADVVTLFVSRMLTVPPSPEVQQRLAAFLEKELGTNDIAAAQSYMEESLRLLMHLVLSLPEYQLG
jgi:hypothetical protein